MFPSPTTVACRNAFESDLTGADYEAKNLEPKDPTPNNTEVKALKPVYTAYTGNSNITNMNLSQGGPTSLVIFRTDEDVEQDWKRVYPWGKTTGRLLLEIPVSCVLDGVEILKHSIRFEAGADINTKRLFQEVDAGFTFVNSASGNAGEKLVRRTLSTTSNGRRILKDTNNSTNDFICTTSVKPREYKDSYK